MPDIAALIDVAGVDSVPDTELSRLETTGGQAQSAALPLLSEVRFLINCMLINASCT